MRRRRPHPLPPVRRLRLRKVAAGWKVRTAVGRPQAADLAEAASADEVAIPAEAVGLAVVEAAAILVVEAAATLVVDPAAAVADMAEDAATSPRT